MQNEMFSKLKVHYIVKSANDDIVNFRELYRKVLQIAMSQSLGIAMSQSLGIAISQSPDDSYIAKSRQ